MSEPNELDIEMERVRMEREYAERPCTCTLACQPRAITEEQTCKESMSARA